jgi:hypothetical protein
MVEGLVERNTYTVIRDRSGMIVEMILPDDFDETDWPVSNAIFAAAMPAVAAA